jgi:type II secretory pathway component PulJ
MTRSLRGVTLVELLFSCSLLLLGLALCGRLAVLGLRSRNPAMEKNLQFRQIITVLEQLERDVRSCRRFYRPDLSDLAPHQETLVLSNYSTDGTLQVVGWRLDQGRLQRTIYNLDFNPSVAATHVPLAGSRSLQTTGVERFQMRQLPPGEHFGSRLLELEVVCAAPARHRLLTTIGLREL